MADHSNHSHGGGHMDMTDARQTYEGFIRGSIVIVLLSLFICVCLVMVRFTGAGNVLLGLGGLVVGLLALLIDARSGNMKFPISAGWAVLFLLLTAYRLT